MKKRIKLQEILNFRRRRKTNILYQAAQWQSKRAKRRENHSNHARSKSSTNISRWTSRWGEENEEKLYFCENNIRFQTEKLIVFQSIFLLSSWAYFSS